MTEQKKINFEEGSDEQPVRTQGAEFDAESFSDKAYGDSKKYVRQNLDKKTVKILKAQVFSASPSDEPITAVNNPAVKYKKAQFIVTFDSKNEDGVNDREYYSGATQFVQRDGSLSEPKFYRAGAENQVNKLWELISAHKKVEPSELSPREFISILNSGIKVKIKSETIKFQGKVTTKNMISEVLG